MVLSLRAEARLDLEAAARWYEAQEPGLGRMFVQEVRQAFHVFWALELLTRRRVEIAEHARNSMLGSGQRPDRDQILITDRSEAADGKRQQRLSAARCGDKLNLDIFRIVNGYDSTEIAQLQTSIRNVMGESNCLVQDEHDLLRKCGDELWLSGMIGDQPDRSEWSGCSVGAFQRSTDDNFHAIGAHLDPLNRPSLPMAEEIITKSYPGFNGVAE